MEGRSHRWRRVNLTREQHGVIDPGLAPLAPLARAAARLIERHVPSSAQPSWPCLR